MNKKIESPPGGLEYERELDESVTEAKPRSRNPQRRSSKKNRDPLNGHMIRHFSKEALDVLRAFVTVAIICYAATKSPAWYLTALADAAKIALDTYALSYLSNYMSWFDRPRTAKWLDALFALVFLLIAYVSLSAIFNGVNVTIDQLLHIKR
jgi:hypothetical protein